MIKELIERVKLTDEEIEKVKSGVGLTDEGNGVFSMHIYDEQRAIAKAQLNKVLNDPDLAMKGERGFIYLEDAMKEVKE